MREREFQEWLRQAAQLFGWRYMHVHDSRHGAAGWPDAFLVKSGRALAFELKVGKREPTEHQRLWLAELARVPGIEVMVAYPEDRTKIEEKLRAA